MNLTDEFRTRGITSTTRYQPKNHWGVFRSVCNAVWQVRHDEMMAQATEVGEVVARWLEAKYPLADMEVLARYDLAPQIYALGVHVYAADTDQWSEWTGIRLPRAVRVPSNGRSGYVGGPQWSRHPTCGHDPDYWAILGPERQAEERREAADRQRLLRLPRETEPFFEAVIRERRLFESGTREAFNAYLPAYRSAHGGKFPTWGEIADAFPRVGEAIRSAIGSRPSESV